MSSRAALMAINCEQYRICHTGLCPTGVTNHNPVLTKQLNVAKGIENLSNFIQISTNKVANLSRIMGVNDIRHLNPENLISLNIDLAKITGVKFVNGKNL